MSTRTQNRSRISTLLFAACLAAGSVAGRGAAQAPEFGNDEVPADSDETLAGDSAETAPMGDAAPSMEGGEPGYSSSSVPELEHEETELEAEDDERVAPKVQFGAEIGVFTAGGSSSERSHTAVSPLLRAGIGLSRHLALTATWGLSYQADGALGMQQSETAVVMGNPLIAIAQQTRIGRTYFDFGGGVALPVASTPKDPVDAAITGSAYGYAAALRGNWSQWLWAPDRASATVHFASHAVLDELLVGGEADVAALIPTVGEDDMEVAGQLAGEVGYATDKVRVVMRVTGVATISMHLDDPFQVALDPYVTWNLTKRTALMGRLTVNCDNPAGVDGLGIWALRLGANVAL
jgi:hypothetical protein